MLTDLRDAAKTLIDAPVVDQESLAEIRVPKALVNELKTAILDGKAFINERTSFVPTSEARATAPENYAIFPNQFFVFAINLFPFAKELLKYFTYLDLFRSHTELLQGNSDEIRQKISGSPLNGEFSTPQDLILFSKFVDNSDDQFRLGAKSPVNIKSDGRVLIRPSEDCFGSVILTQINIPNSSSSIFGDLVYSLVNREDLVEKLSKSIVKINSSQTQNDYCILFKPFLLLAGISGTGKSRFVRKQAEASGSIDKNYKLISVRPDWHEPSDLLGYVSRISGAEKYIVTDALKFMVSAWCDACDLDNTSGEVLANKAPSEMNTFWLCLDEMNLAPVEQYFADYLSVIETRKWDGDSYSCDAILKADTIKLLSSAAATNLRNDLGLTDIKYDSLWSYFSEIGIPLPPNLIVAGTVNMDETTHGFSRKVIDRALTLDFGQFFPNDFDAFFEPTSTPVIFSFPTLSQATQSDFNDVTIDSNGQKSLEFLKGINVILKGTMFELAYRALNELFISVICIKPKNDIELQAVWDDFLMTKVLPRIEGDDDKLKIHNDSNSKEILKALDEYIKQQLPLIYETELRPDFFRIDISSNKPVEIRCRSRAKLEWMSIRLKNNGFTTFWP